MHFQKENFSLLKENGENISDILAVFTNKLFIYEVDLQKKNIFFEVGDFFYNKQRGYLKITKFKEYNHGDYMMAKYQIEVDKVISKSSYDLLSKNLNKAVTNG